MGDFFDEFDKFRKSLDEKKQKERMENNNDSNFVEDEQIIEDLNNEQLEVDEQEEVEVEQIKDEKWEDESNDNEVEEEFDIEPEEDNDENISLEEEVIEDSIENSVEEESDDNRDYRGEVPSDEEWENESSDIEVEKDFDIDTEEDEEENDKNEESSNDEQQNGYEDWDYDDDDDYIDLEEEALEFSSDKSNSISFDEINDSDNDNVEENLIGVYGPEEKKGFGSVNPLESGKSSFKPGKLNKTVMLSAIGIFMLVVVGLFYLQGIKEEKKKNTDKASQNNISLAGYEPDFGNYQERAYKPTQVDENKEDSKYINDVFNGGNKKEYKPDQNTNNTNNNANTYTQQPPTYNQSVPAQSSSGSVDTSNLDAINSPIRLSVAGYTSDGYPNSYGYSNTYGEPNGYNGGNLDYVSYNGNSGSYEQNYIDRIETLTNLTQGENTTQIQQNSTKRMGEYDPSMASGNYSYIAENSLFPGTIIHASLISGIDTRFPGPIIARVINPVYDSKTGKTLLIPQGSILRGGYSSASFGVSKVQIAWNELIINRDGKSYTINLGSMAGVDRKGRSGLAGTLHENAFQYLKAMGVSCLFTFINSNIYSYTDSQKSALQKQMLSDSQQIGNMLADKILDRALDIEPYIKIKQGRNISVSVDKILTLPALDSDKPKQKYIRK